MVDIPSNWERKIISDLCDFSSGHGFRPKDWSDSGLPIIRIQNLNDSEDFNYFAGEPQDKWLVEPGTILFAWAGTRGVSFGPTIWEGPLGVLNQHIYRIHPKDDINKQWLYLVLEIITRRIEQKAHGFKATLLHVRKADITDQVVGLPPLEEQRKIAEILGTWDEAIAQVEQLIAALQQRKKGLMQRLLTGQVRFPEFEGKRPWDTVKIGKVASLTAGGTPSTRKPTYWGGIIPWMRSGDIHKERIYEVDGRITQEGLENSSAKLLPENCVLIALAGQGKTRGSVAINKIELSTNQSVAAMTPDQSKLDYEYLFYNLTFRYEELRRLSTGDGGRGGLNLKLLKNIKIPLPSINEQQKIATVLQTCDEEIQLLEQQHGTLQQQKKGLMQRLLTGQIRVNTAHFPGNSEFPGKS